MATMIPKTIPESAPRSEKIVFRALAGLSSEWTVFHGVTWQSERHGRQGDGEADFVLLNPRRGLIVLEVKGGTVSIERGQWISASQDGGRHKIRNPFEQALDSRKALMSYLADKLGGSGKIHDGHAVCFPGVQIDHQTLGPAASPEITLDLGDLDNSEVAIDRIADHWELNSRMDVGLARRIAQLIAPTVTVKRLARDVVAEVRLDLLELTDRQIETMRQLRKNRRLLVTGGAGTGKTVLAVERARQLAADGFEVLLTCFNSPLGQHLESTIAGVQGATATNFHTFARGLIADSGRTTPGHPTDDWWVDDVPKLLSHAIADLDHRVDAVIVDEGQDFHPAWWAPLFSLLRSPEDGPFYVFADSNQQIYVDDWSVPFVGVEFELDINCRNTIPIAERVAAVFGSDIPTLGTQGPSPIFGIARTPDDVEEPLAKLLDHFLNKGALEQDQVVVLSPSRRLVDQLRGTESAGWGLVEPGEDGVVVDTVHRFKGLEADAVILVIPALLNDDDRALAYVGMSRARVYLAVIGPASVKDALSWP